MRKKRLPRFFPWLITPWEIVIPFTESLVTKEARQYAQDKPQKRKYAKEQHTPDRNYEWNPVDVHVGGARSDAGFLLELTKELRTALGVTVEKMQAYESGAMRIGPGLLYEVSKLLNCPPTAFFDDRFRERVNFYALDI